MNKVLAAASIFIIQFFISDLYGQQFYYGLPVDTVELDSGDVIIMNVPYNTSARLIESHGLDSLIHFLKTNEGIDFKIYIHDFLIGGEHSMRYSKALAESLSNYLGQQEVKNCKVYGKGDGSPFFCDKKHPRYNFINTRLELHVQ